MGKVNEKAENDLYVSTRSYKCTELKGTRIVRLSQPLCYLNSDQFAQSFKELSNQEDGRRTSLRLILDMSHVTFVVESGARVLQESLERNNQFVAVVICWCSGRIL